MCLIVAAASTPAMASATDKISSMGDAFLVDSPGPKKGKPTQQPTWFCGGAESRGSIICDGTSYDAATALANSSELPEYLRVAKARNDCVHGQASKKCVTGVPPTDPCEDVGTPKDPVYGAEDEPFCALQALKKKTELGLIIGAAKEGPEGQQGKDQKARPLSDITWHACEALKDDKSNLYSFLFLDEATALDTDALKRVVPMIQRGQVLDKKSNEKTNCTAGKWSHLITNDRNYKPKKGLVDRLHTGVWAHAKSLAILDRNNIATELKKGALLAEDREFIKDVPNNSQAILRFEVTAQTSVFAGLSGEVQCELLTKVAAASRGFELIYPLYVHGTTEGDKPDHAPYSSFFEGTFELQLGLLNGGPAGVCTDFQRPPPTGPEPEPTPSPCPPEDGGDPRVGALLNDGTFLVKEGPLDANWCTQGSGIATIALAGDRIGALLTDGTFLVKDGFLTAEWATLATGVKEIALSGDRIGAVLNDGTFLAKEGELSAAWVTENTGVAEIALANNRIGAILNDGTFLAKEGALSAGWVTEATESRRSHLHSGGSARCRPTASSWSRMGSCRPDGRRWRTASRPSRLRPTGSGRCSRMGHIS